MVLRWYQGKLNVLLLQMRPFFNHCIQDSIQFEVIFAFSHMPMISIKFWCRRLAIGELRRPKNHLWRYQWKYP